MQPIQIGFVMDPITEINPRKDSTLALMLEAQERGWKLVYLTLNDIGITNGETYALFKTLKVYNSSELWFEILEESYHSLKDLDIIFMRKDPPFNIEYIISTYILEQAEREGVLVVNKPSTLRDVNEKMFASIVPQCCPPTIFTRSKKMIHEFIATHHKVVVKPLDKMGGQSIFIITEGDPNTNVIIEEVTKNESNYIEIQAYIPEIESSGDKRILLINGEPIDKGIARIPQGNDHRGNMAVGAKVSGFNLSERDYWICAQLKDELIARGLFFVGLDIIGDYMTEINITSPTGIKEMEELFNLNVTKLILDDLEKLYLNHLKQST